MGSFVYDHVMRLSRVAKVMIALYKHAFALTCSNTLQFSFKIKVFHVSLLVLCSHMLG
jgi:hypothetical protein